MKLPEFNEKGERMVLDHDPVPPYRAVFWTAFAIGSLYLIYILMTTLGAGAAH